MIDDFVQGHGVGLTVVPGARDELVAALEEMLDATTNVRFREAAVRTAAAIPWEHEQRVLSSVYGPAA